MPLPKEKMREYQKLRRKKPVVNPPVNHVNLVNQECKPVNRDVNHVTVEEYLALSQRVAYLEGMVAGLERRMLDVVGSKFGVGKPVKADPGLFQRVIAEKEKRLRG